MQNRIIASKSKKGGLDSAGGLFYASGLSRSAFTLAEVLITLGIIGVVAAMTLPALVQNYQQMVLKNQFKKIYATFYNAIKQTQANLGYPPRCYYWASGAKCQEVCIEKDPVYNSCTKWKCADGSELQFEHNGSYTDCAAFETELFNNVFKTVKFCKNNALKTGCLTDAYKGTDKIKAEQNPDSEYPPNPSSDFSDSNIKNKYSSWIINDGTVIIKYGNFGGPVPIYTVDLNGHKGPNKWGYDIFTFQLKGDSSNGITKIDGIVYVIEKGGKSTAQMIQEMYK